MKNFEIKGQLVRFQKIMKFEGLVSNSSEAKATVAAGRDLVKGQAQTRKRRQSSPATSSISPAKR